jgi:transmembrane sensor
MDKVERKRLIKSLLSGRLSKKQRKAFADLESVDIEIKKQWNESGNKTIDLKIKEQIWEKVKARCIDRKKDKVLSELGI